MAMVTLSNVSGFIDIIFSGFNGAAG
jgi:hypothetical protein